MATFNDAEASETGKFGRRKSDAAILGVPYDMGSTLYAGQRNAPWEVRQGGYWPDMTHHSANVDPMVDRIVVDTGDVVVTAGDSESSITNIRDTAHSIKENTRCLVSIGGDNSASVQLLAGVVLAEGSPITLFHFDSYVDYTKPETAGELNHRTWVRRAIDENLVNRVVQIGIRGWGPSLADRRWAEKNDIVSYSAMEDWRKALREELADTADPVYMSVDMSVLDPAFAPGVAHQEPGGFSVRELFQSVMAVAASGKLIGADIMEAIPDRDPTGSTVRVANRLVAQVLTGLSTV